MFFFFNDTATTEIYTLSLHDALPISAWPRRCPGSTTTWASIAPRSSTVTGSVPRDTGHHSGHHSGRSEEHTSELQSRQYLVCRLLLEKKKKSKESPLTSIFTLSPTPH